MDNRYNRANMCVYIKLYIYVYIMCIYIAVLYLLFLPAKEGLTIDNQAWLYNGCSGMILYLYVLYSHFYANIYMIEIADKQAHIRAFYMFYLNNFQCFKVP